MRADPRLIFGNSGSGSGSGVGNDADTSSEVAPAQVGFNAGDGERFVSLPGSQTEAILNISPTSNVGEPGFWIFRVDGDDIVWGGMSNTIVVNSDDRS